MYNKRIRVNYKKDEPLTPERIKKIRDQGLKDYQSQLVVIKADIVKALEEKASVIEEIAAKKQNFSSWVQSQEDELNVKRNETNEYIKGRKETLCDKIQEELRLIRENNKIFEQIKAAETEIAYDLRKMEVEKKDAVTLIAQSRISEERAVAEVKNQRVLITQFEDLSIKINRELEMLQQTKDALIGLNNRYDQRVETFKQLRKEVVAKENDIALRELQIEEKLNKINEIAKSEGDEL